MKQQYDERHNGEEHYSADIEAVEGGKKVTRCVSCIAATKKMTGFCLANRTDAVLRGSMDGEQHNGVAWQHGAAGSMGGVMGGWRCSSARARFRGAQTK